MKKYTSYIIGSLLIIAAALSVSAGGALHSRSRLLKSVSQKQLVETARDHQWSVNFAKRGQDTVHIIALRVQFQADTSSLTTGNGQFGMRGDLKEQRFYAQDTTYRFDKLDHDLAYFTHQLDALRRYYGKVSRGNLTLDFSIYPGTSGETGYTVGHPMTHYSPGYKRKTESIDEYWNRKTHGLMLFIHDALKTAGEAMNSPFKNLVRDEATGTLRILRDNGTPGHKAAILILHAGASYLTDGGMDGAAAADSPSDMIDAFIDPEFFKHFKDTLGLEKAGIPVIGNGGKSITIDEVMMCAETSNQDGLNWGIQGVLVNQMARQLGIPDLFSRSSGVSAVGAFCIMDFAGYSAGQGFIPPYPSAWVRAFMGWDTPKIAGAGSSPRVKALTSVLDNTSNWDTGDTTILLVPINNNEYYLIENRQRNLSEDPSFFRYDLQEKHSVGIINAYPFNVNLERNIDELADPSGRRVITMARNNDISLPASGVLVWHVDERVIRGMLPYNLVNADSSYRGVRLVEADGVNDLGVTFTDAFYQAAFDYGGAEDVFPYKTFDKYNKNVVSQASGFGPHTRPSTRANDGGHTFLDIEFTRSNNQSRTELSQNFQGNNVENYSDSVFTVRVSNNSSSHIVSGWPRRAAPESFFDPLITEITADGNGTMDTVLALLGESGRFYMYSVNKNITQSYGNHTTPIELVDYHGKPVESNISVTYFDSIPGVFTLPTAINGCIFIPSSHDRRHVINVYCSVDINGTMPYGKTPPISLPAKPTSYVCGVAGHTVAVGLADGTIFFTSAGNGIGGGAPLPLKSGSPVHAIAALKDNLKQTPPPEFAAIQDNGTLSVVRQKTDGNWEVVNTAALAIKNALPPFKIVTGDLDNDGKSEIVVTDSRQGVWVFTRDLKLAQGWRDTPNDWANTYHIDPDSRAGRDRFTFNGSAPALADLNRDGALDIIISGTNGVYALNRKGALLSKWPAYLDNRYWYQRGSVASSPVVVAAEKGEPLVLFSSPTGENATFTARKIETADKARGVVTFRRENGTLDSLWELSAATIDTILTLGDSLIYPYVLPGGFVDALDANATRPARQIGSWRVPQSRWPLSTGAPVTTSPLVYRASPNGAPDLFAAASDGMIYRWKLTGMLSDAAQTLPWPQTGFDAARSFAFGGASTDAGNIITEKEPITFWNYPNPTAKDEPFTTFKYKFNGDAKNVRLDIYTMTGRRMDSFKNLSGDFPDWNEIRVNLRKYGPGIYRCRMEATINRRKYSKFWKMAVVK